MKKKILIGVGIVIVLGMVVVSLMGYEFFKMASDKFEEHKPELRQYITMTVDEQNIYIEKNLDKIMSWFANNTEDDINKENFEKAKAAPDAKAAGIELGRAIIATAILSSDDLKENLKADIKEKFQKESDELEMRWDNWTKIVDKYVPDKSK